MSETMIKLLSVLLFCAGVTFAAPETSRSKTFIEVYSWRDYYGTIPKDALVAGLSKNRQPLYIGQTIFKDAIIPGKILEGDNKLYFEYFNVEHSVSKNVKIFCSHQPEKLEWISTSSGDLLNLAKQRTLFIGGSEPTCNTYLGRLPPVDDVTNVGKVVCCEVQGCFGMYTTEDGSGRLYSQFEVLSYVDANPNVALKVSTTKTGKNKGFSIDLVLD